MGNFIENTIQTFKKANMVVRLIYVNVFVFIVLLLTALIAGLFIPSKQHPGLVESMAEWAKWLMLYPKIADLIVNPWTIITHMFTHIGVMHLLFNMLMLYFSGQLFVQFFNEKKLLATYLLGGLSGAVVLILASSFLPYFEDHTSLALGASAAVMAITIAVCTYSPNTKVNLFGVLPIELRFLGLLIFLMDLLQFYDGNTGGHLAHIAGAIFGFYSATQLKKGKDVTKGFLKFLDWFFSLFKKKTKLYVSHSTVRKMSDEDFNLNKKRVQERIDEILDKIGRSGYDSLTKEEKDFLNNSSRQ